MTNEQEENVNLIHYIESHKCHYDIKSYNYSRQDIKEKAWNEILIKTNNSSKLMMSFLS
jgi:hypothetical protein